MRQPRGDTRYRVRVTGRRRVDYDAWGRGLADLALPAYALASPGEGDAAAVWRAIERATGLHLCGGPRNEGRDADGARHYAATLGSPCRSGGWTPRAEIWIAIPARGRSV